MPEYTRVPFFVLRLPLDIEEGTLLVQTKLSRVSYLSLAMTSKTAGRGRLRTPAH